MGVAIWEGNKAQELINAVKAVGGQFDFTDAASIVSAIRSGHADKVPNGTVFKETHAVYGDIYFVTRAKNQHKVAGDSSRPTITIQPLYLLSSNGGTSAATFQFDRQEAFCTVAEDILAGTVCKFTATTYGGWTGGTYYFTADNIIPAGAKLCISAYQNTALTSCNVNVYASVKATSALAQYQIYSGDGDATVDLGAWETEGHNHPQRISYGSNNDAQSNLFQWLNTDSGTHNMVDYFEPQTEFDMMDTSFASKKGFLGGFSDEFRSYLGLCAIPNITNNVWENGYTKNSAYTYNGYFFLPSRKEVYGSNESAAEDAEVQFDYYKDIATTNADKLMYAKNASSPTPYWLRTPYVSGAFLVRVCSAGDGGALDNGIAINSIGAAPLAILA